MNRMILSFILAVMLCGCTGPEPSFMSVSTFNYKNISDSDATMIVHNMSPFKDEIFNIKSKATASYSKNDYGKPSNPFSYCDSITIKFNEQKQKTYTAKDKDPRNPMFLESYTETKIDDDHYVLDYTISIDNF